MTVRSKRNYDITALQRGLRLLHLFSESPRGLTAKQVASLSRLPVSTVHRFLANLVTSGFLNRDVEGNHHLGIACFSIGQAAAGQLDIRRLSLPYLRELNQQTRETIHLTMRHGLSAVYVEKLDSPEPLRIFSRIGASVPLHCTAVGKVMLAYLPEDEQDRVLTGTRSETPDLQYGRESPGIENGDVSRPQERLCLRHGRTRVAHTLRGRADMGSHWQCAIESQHHRPGVSHVGRTLATVGTAHTGGRTENLG